MSGQGRAGRPAERYDATDGDLSEGVPLASLSERGEEGELAIDA